MSFKVGEVVRLKGGGPAMTITGTSIGPDRSALFNCSWFDSDKREQLGAFPADALALVAPSRERTAKSLPTMANTRPPNDDGTGWMS
jgi:uncharacterized protein YodC (DUF2158 family)